MGPIAFPFKLWEIVEHSSAPDSEYPILISWNMDGNSILVDAINFESYVAVRYPKFLRRSTLDCLQKLLYHYQFELAEGDFFGVLQYWHPCFIRGRSDLLLLVTNRQMHKSKTLKPPPNPPSWSAYHGDYCSDDHCSESHDCPDEGKKLDQSTDRPRPINRSTNQYKFWRRTGRIATFTEPHALYEEIAGNQMSPYSLGRDEAYGAGPAPLLDFLDKTSSSLKEALEVGETATPSGRGDDNNNNFGTPKMSLKVSLKNSLQPGGDQRFATPPQPLFSLARYPPANTEMTGAQRQLTVIAPIDPVVVVVKPEPTEDPRESEMMSTFVEEEDAVTTSSSTPPFAMLNTPTAIRIEPDFQDDWFCGEKRAYYAL